MKQFLPSSGFSRKLLAILVGQLCLLGAIGAVVSHQVRLVDQKITEMADLKDPSPFTGSLVGVLNQINLNLLSYGQSRDPQAQQRMTEGEKQFEDSLREFQQANPRLFPATAHERILNAYLPFKGAVQAILSAYDDQAERWDQLLNNDDQILFLFEHRLRPIVRMNQTMATARLDLILNLENEVRLVPKDLTQYRVKPKGGAEKDLDLNDRKFETLLRIYERISPLANERKGLEKIGSLWGENLAMAQNIVKIEQRKTEAFSQMLQANQTLQNTISWVLPAVRPEVIEEKKTAIFHTITLILVSAGLMVVGGVISLILSGLWIYRKVRRSFEKIKEVAEAAATGDLSREVETGNEKEFAGMGESVNRLIGVMRRSEKLIYQLGSIVESSGDAAIGMTLEGTILSWNHNAQRMYGYSSEEIKDHSISMLFAPDEVAYVKLIAEKLRDGKKVACDTVHVRKSGVKINVHLIVSRILDSTGNTIGISMLSREQVPMADTAPVKNPNLAA